MTIIVRNKDVKGGRIYLMVGVILGAIVSGIVATATFLGLPSLLSFAFGVVQDGGTFRFEDFASANADFGGVVLTTSSIVSVFCLIFGSIFLAENRQSGLAKYGSGAIVGAVCFSIAALALGFLFVLIKNEGIAAALVFAVWLLIPSLLAGAAGALAFLAVVHLFDFNGRVFPHQVANTKPQST